MSEFIVIGQRTEDGIAIDFSKSAVGELVRCKDCKHKPHTKEPDGDGYGFDITADGDFTCPFLCDDGYYNRMPSDDFYCSYGE